jgi:hypothetical protein
MGKTVGVGIGRTENPNGITSYKRMAYIVPQYDKWFFTYLDNHTTENEQVYSTLKEACNGVEKLFDHPKLK